MKWLLEQESVDASTFHLTPLFDPMVLPHDVQAFLRHIKQSLHPVSPQTPEYEPEQIHSMVELAFELCGEYLCQPIGFLSQFLFAEETTTTKNSIAEKLRILEAYPFYKEFLELWLSEQPERVSKVQCLTYLYQVDHTMYSHASEETIELQLEPLFAFFKEADLNGIINLFLTDRDIYQTYTVIPPDKTSVAAFIKEHVGLHSTYTPGADSAIDYPVFLEDLKQAGIHLPPPSAKPIEKEVSITEVKTPPIELFISAKLKEKTIDKLFHGNRFEYHRVIGLINASTSFDEAQLNLETALHLQRSGPSEKHLAKLLSALQLKFSNRN